jgi:cation-transporting ATPase E
VVSGDHPVTVAAIAAAVGVPGAEAPVDAAGLSDEQLFDLVEHRSVFGRVSPQQKRVIIAALQTHGHTVAMTGDGVNDVLALKDADIGVAMGSGSAATRGVAQLVLLDDAFSALPPVIGEGRRVIANVERVANLFITKTVYATLIAFLVALTQVAYPLLPRHLTIVSDFSIGIPAFVLSLLPNSRRFRPGFVGRVLWFAVPAGVIAGAAAMTAYYIAYSANLSLVKGRTTATIVLVTLGLWVLSLLARPFTTVKAALVAAMAGCFAGMLAVAPVRRYFALSLPPSTQLVLAVAIIVVAGAALQATYSRVRAAAGLT